MIYYICGIFFFFIVVFIVFAIYKIVKVKFKRRIENYKIQRTKNAYIKNTKNS